MAWDIGTLNTDTYTRCFSSYVSSPKQPHHHQSNQQCTWLSLFPNITVLFKSFQTHLVYSTTSISLTETTNRLKTECLVNRNLPSTLITQRVEGVLATMKMWWSKLRVSSHCSTRCRLVPMNVKHTFHLQDLLCLLWIRYTFFEILNGSPNKCGFFMDYNNLHSMMRILDPSEILQSSVRHPGYAFWGIFQIMLKSWMVSTIQSSRLPTT